MPFRSSGIDEKLRIKAVFCDRINYFELSLPIILNFQDTLLRKKPMGKGCRTKWQIRYFYDSTFKIALPTPS